MAATSSKGLPSALHHFAHGTPFDLHRDLAPSSSRDQSSSASGSFRQRNWPAPSGGTDDDFGRFSAAQSTPWSTHGRAPAEGWASSMVGGEGSERRDGEDVMALLGSSSVSEQVDSDWEAELMEDQQKRAAHDLRMPSDPFASARALAIRTAREEGESSRSASYKGKGPAHDMPMDAGRPQTTSGDLSPVSSELISSLSSLDLNSRTYLKSLLSLPPDEALEDYFTRGTYSDDVYGLPADVQQLFEKAQAGGESREEGRAKAVRRLGMVMKHLWNEEGGASQAFTASADWSTEAWSMKQRAGDVVLSQGQKGKEQTAEEQTSRDAQQQDGRQIQSPYLQAHQQQMQHQHLVASQRPPILSTCVPPPTETSYRTDFSSQLAREEPRRDPHPHRPEEKREEEEQDLPLPPFSYFMQRKVEELATLGFPPSPPLDDVLSYVRTEEGRSH